MPVDSFKGIYTCICGNVYVTREEASCFFKYRLRLGDTKKMRTPY